MLIYTTKQLERNSPFIVHFANLEYIEQSYGHLFCLYSTISSSKLKYIQQLFHQYFHDPFYDINNLFVVTVIYQSSLWGKTNKQTNKPTAYDLYLQISTYQSLLQVSQASLSLTHVKLNS